MIKKINTKMLMLALLKYLLKLVIGIGIFSVIIMLVAHFNHFELSKTFLWAGIIIGTIGFLSFGGNSDMTVDNLSFLQCLNYKSQDQMARDFLKLRDGGMNFSIFILLVAVGLVGISYLISFIV